MQFLLVFLEGIITFISPCLLPMLPIYLSYFAAGETDRKKTIKNAIGFVAGFTVVFLILGIFAGTFGMFMQRHMTIINIICGAFVILMGLNFTGILKIGIFNRTKQLAFDTKNLSFFSAFLFGIVFSIGWTPCVGAFLGSALMMAAVSGSVIQGSLMLLLFSLGLGLPFIFSALLIDRLKGAFTFIKKNYNTINLLSGILLIIIGILIATGILGRFLLLLTF